MWSDSLPASSEQRRTLEIGEILFSLSRRHALPYSAIAVRLEASRDAAGLSRVEAGIVAELRRTDLLLRGHSRGRWTVLCPSTAAQGCKELAVRIQQAVGAAPLATASACLGEDAYTLPDLIDRAWSRLREAHGEGDDPGGPWGGGPRRVVRSLRAHWRRRAAARVKRIFDVATVLIAAPLWLPITGLVAAAIALSEPEAPVLFRQARTGRGGRRFAMLKFRTMVPDAEEMKPLLQHLNTLTWPDFKIDNDPRITRVGRLLRKTSLDELPQLWNVMLGDMSLVGPRPTSFVPETYDPWHTARLDVAPGLTGLWQVEGRLSTDFDERLRLDLRYIERQTFCYDLWILLRTVPAVLTMRGGQ